MTKVFVRSVMAATLWAASAPALAGEIKGPPPTGNYTNPELNVPSASLCSFSGLNDSPLGDPSVGDPGGISQSFGSFGLGHIARYLDPHEEDSASPGWSCNPTRNIMDEE
jgi:hypothetical protein